MVVGRDIGRQCSETRCFLSPPTTTCVVRRDKKRGGSGYGSVTAPRSAPVTNLAYFARTPVV